MANNINENIKVDLRTSDSELEFLDVLVKYYAHNLHTYHLPQTNRSRETHLCTQNIRTPAHSKESNAIWAWDPCTVHMFYR